MDLLRGQIWFADIKINEENVQRGQRPALVLSNNKANFYSPVITICPISTVAKGQKTHVPIFVDKECFCLCEQILTISKKSLMHYKKMCTEEELQAVDRALNIQLDKPQIEVFNVNRAIKLAQSIMELENFLEEYADKLCSTKEIAYSIQVQLQELKDYCSKYNVNYLKFYNKPKSIKLLSII